jgi:hypothetical protein
MWKIVAALVGALLVLCCVGGALVLVNGNRLFGGINRADKGDCLAGKSIDESSDRFQPTDLKVVKCTDDAAKYQVLGRVKNKTKAEAEADRNICGAFPEATKMYWFGRKDTAKGTVLCLKNK